MACTDCFRGGTWTHAEPQGSMTTTHGISCYVTPPSTTATNPTKNKIIYFPDGGSLRMPNNLLLADRYAREANAIVIIPDVVPLGGMDPRAGPYVDGMMKPVTPWWDMGQQMWRVWSAVWGIWYMAPFVMKSDPSAEWERCLGFMRAVRREMDREGRGGKLGVAGFCWGGYAATRCCAEGKEVDGSGKEERLVDACVVGHPASLKTPEMFVDAVKKFHVPYCCVVGDQDMLLPLKKVEEVQKALLEQVGKPETNDYEISVYKGCVHGFSVRAVPWDENQVEKQEEAIREGCNWWRKYLT